MKHGRQYDRLFRSPWHPRRSSRNRCLTFGGLQWPRYDSVANDPVVWPSYTDFCTCSSLDSGAHKDEPNPSRLSSVYDSDLLSACDAADVYMQRWRDSPFGNIRCPQDCHTGTLLDHQGGWEPLNHPGDGPAVHQMLRGSGAQVPNDSGRLSGGISCAASSTSERGRLLFTQLSDESCCGWERIGAWEPLPNQRRFGLGHGYIMGSVKLCRLCAAVGLNMPKTELAWNVLSSSNPAGQTAKVAMRRAIGRSAVIAFIGLFLQDSLPDSAWGDTAVCAASSFHALGRERGVWDPGGLWDAGRLHHGMVEPGMENECATERMTANSEGKLHEC
ncbi:unnamed protein product [Symbiodinium sp. CCMP2456]|nr:unnamed protein product [Symbiodinium sp. CCMP2456]